MSAPAAHGTSQHRLSAEEWALLRAADGSRTCDALDRHGRVPQSPYFDWQTHAAIVRAQNVERATLALFTMLLTYHRLAAADAARLAVLAPAADPRHAPDAVAAEDDTERIGLIHPHHVETAAVLLRADAAGLAVPALAGWLERCFATEAQWRLLAAGTPEPWVREAEGARR